MNPKSIRFNEIKDHDLIAFFNEKGFKQGIRFLYDFYNNNQNINVDVAAIADHIVLELKRNNIVHIEKKAVIKDDNNKEFNFKKDSLMDQFL